MTSETMQLLQAIQSGFARQKALDRGTGVTEHFGVCIRNARLSQWRTMDQMATASRTLL